MWLDSTMTMRWKKISSISFCSPSCAAAQIPNRFRPTQVPHAQAKQAVLAHHHVLNFLDLLHLALQLRVRGAPRSAVAPRHLSITIKVPDQSIKLN